ncbi:hypothetical protein CF326_g8455 [Tilletia indica]|nr:hypothetical protein CF326_g8455 [Tilletia indica]
MEGLNYGSLGAGSFSPEYLVIPGGKSAVPTLTSRPPTVNLEIPSRPYITHLLNLSPLLVYGTSTEDAINVFDPSTPSPDAVRRLVWNSASSSSSSISALVAAPPTAPSQATLYTPSTNGKIAVWDLRNGSGGAVVAELVGKGAPSVDGGRRPAAPADGPAYLCAAASEDGYTLAAGTELRGTDAVIDIWDLRSPAAPLFTYSESHSDDVSTLSFCPSLPSTSSSPSGVVPRSALLLSGSTDGLLSIFNTAVAQGDEDDAVVRVQNLGASLARVGWGAGLGASFGAVGDGMEVEEEDDEKARELAARTPKGLGGVWGVTDMQTLSVFDADTFDNTTLSSFPVRSRTSLMPAFEPDYVVDLWPSSRLPTSSLSSSAGLSLWEGDSNGNFALVGIPPPAVLVGDQATSEGGRKAEAWELGAFFPAGRRAHEDIVRCVEYDQNTQTLFTGGEDGRICFWNLGGGGGGEPAASEEQEGAQLPTASFQATTPTAQSAVGGGGGNDFSGKARKDKVSGNLVGGAGRDGGRVRYRPF